jgi:hypothetical protein
MFLKELSGGRREEGLIVFRTRGEQALVPEVDPQRISETTEGSGI